MNFLTECDTACHFEDIDETAEKRCAQKYDVGTCEADIERFFFHRIPLINVIFGRKTKEFMLTEIRMVSLENTGIRAGL